MTNVAPSHLPLSSPPHPSLFLALESRIYDPISLSYIFVFLFHLIIAFSELINAWLARTLLPGSEAVHTGFKSVPHFIPYNALQPDLLTFHIHVNVENERPTCRNNKIDNSEGGQRSAYTRSQVLVGRMI